MITEKECTHCHRVQPVGNFKARSRRPGQLRSWCRVCENAAEAARYRERRAEITASYRAKVDALSDAERAAIYSKVYARAGSTIRALNRSWYARNRGRWKAYQAVKAALLDGRLTKPTVCQWCGIPDKRLVAHHSDYARPLDVEFICNRCHRRHHADQAA